MSEAKTAGVINEPSPLADLPRYYATSFQQIVTGNEFLIIAGQTLPTIVGGEFSTPVTKAVFSLSLSPQCAKEMSIILQRCIAEYEKNFGKIRSQFIDEQKEP